MLEKLVVSYFFQPFLELQNNLVMLLDSLTYFLEV